MEHNDTNLASKSRVACTLLHFSCGSNWHKYAWAVQARPLENRANHIAHSQKKLSFYLKILHSAKRTFTTLPRNLMLTWRARKNVCILFRKKNRGYIVLMGGFVRVKKLLNHRKKIVKTHLSSSSAKDHPKFPRSSERSRSIPAAWQR